MKQILLYIGTVLFIIACDFKAKNEKLLPSSSGKYGEVLVVVDTSYENGTIGTALNEVFNKAMPGLPQLEPQFRLATVAPENFKSILKHARNLLKVSIRKGIATKVNVEKNVWAKEQILINITAPTKEKALSIIEKNTQTIRDYFNEEEIKRLHRQFRKEPQKQMMKEIKKEYKLALTIPPAYFEMKKTKTGVWLKKEKKIGEHEIMQGLIIYSYPYRSDSTFAVDEMKEKRNLFTKEYIQGGREGSYMQVYDEYTPHVKELNVDNLYVKEYRGLWNMKNDFMGGPFIHYTFVDEERQMVVNIDGFVYAPKFNKREYLRELEAIMRSIKISP